MKDFFASMYELLISLYGQDLGYHLFGLNPNNSGDFDALSLYAYVGCAMLLTSIALPILYYKIIDSTKFDKTIHWFLLLLVHTVINGFVAFYLPFMDLQTGKMAQSAMDVVDSSNCVGFGFVNFIYAALFFCIISLLAMRISTNCRNTPFKIWK